MSNEQIEKLKEGVQVMFQIFEAVTYRTAIDPSTCIDFVYKTELIPAEFLGDDGLFLAYYDTEEQAEIHLLDALRILKQHNKQKTFTIIKTYSNAE